MSPSHVVVHAVLIGIVAGLLSLTAPAVVAWGAHLGWLKLRDSPLAFLGSMITVIIFTILALVEIVIDKRASTPSRLASGGLVARIVTGALCGAAIAVSGSQPIALGAALGGGGGAVGAFVGYQLRMRLVRALKVPDWVIASLGDAVAIGCGLLIVSGS